MNKFRRQLAKNPALKFLASLKLTVLCLMLLLVLTLWGTIAQVSDGLYLAQEKFFHSFFFLTLGVIPFPGGQLVMWVMFLNLVAALLIRFVYTWRNIGILTIHFGLILFLLSGYVTLHAAKEGHLTLKEGAASNVSASFFEWELSIWEKGDPTVQERSVTALDLQLLVKGQSVPFNEQGFELKLLEYYPNAHAYTANDGSNEYRNASGIQRLESVSLEIEPEKNTPGAIFEVTTDTEKFPLLLYGSEVTPTPIQANGKTYSALLRFKKYPLPFTVKLIEFIKEEHPGTETAKSFKSRVAVDINGHWREKVISMNNPLRHNDYTFYQSSFSVDKFNRERSTLAVVKNSGRLLPYTATFITFAGLVIHFVMMGFASRKRVKK